MNLNVDKYFTSNSEMKKLKTEINPITDDLAIQLKLKIFEVYNAVKYYGLYISNNTLFFKDEKQFVEIVHFPSAIISALLLNRSSTLIGGGSGSGKTATIRFINRLMTGSSIEKMEDIIHCDKEIQKEDWLGFLDPKKIIKGDGDWELRWGKWTEGVTFTIDEITRGNNNLQNAILLQMNDGRLQYNIRFSKSIPEMRYFMTENPKDELMGNIHVTPLSHAFLDRITQYLVVESPSKWAMKKFLERREDDRSLGYSEDSIVEPLLTLNELRCATILAEKMPIDKDANTLAINLAKNADLCIRAPLYSKSNLQIIKPMDGLCEDCHFEKLNGYCKYVFGSSMRIYKDLLSLGKCYAFWLQLKSVSKYLIHAIASDVISHRLIVSERALRDDKKNTFGDKRMFIKQKYIDFEFGHIPMMYEIEECFNSLIYGKGTEKELQKIKNVANSDLSTRIELLPMITVGINIAKNIMEEGNKETYSCLNKEYKETIQQISEAYKNKDENKIIQIINENGSSPMKNLIQDIGHEYIRKIYMEKLS